MTSRDDSQRNIIFVEYSNKRETVIVLAQRGVVTWKWAKKVSAQDARKVVNGVFARVPDAEIREKYDDGGRIIRRKLRNTRFDEEQTWKKLDPDVQTHLQITPDGKGVDENNPAPQVISVDLTGIQP